jgi:LAO/AO transport system kinase
MRVADTTLVIQAPGAGDDIQAAKAGLLECADVFAVNKADLPGAERVVETLRSMLVLGHVTASSAVLGAGHSAAVSAAAHVSGAGDSWEVPVVACVATRDEGVTDLVERLGEHRSWLLSTPGQARKRERLKQELFGRLREALSATLLERHRNEVDAAAEQVARGEWDLYAATEALVRRWT